MDYIEEKKKGETKKDNNCSCGVNLFCLHADGKVKCYGCGDEEGN